MQYAHGAIQWLAADVATTVYTVSGLPFQPKALRFYWFGLGSAVDAASATVHLRRGVGFATGTADRRCVGSQDQDAAGTQVCVTGYRTDAVAMTLTSTPAADGLLDLNSITSDGFTLIVDDQAPADITIFWEAWGGADILAAATGEIAEPAGAGDQDYVVTGNIKPDVVMFAGTQETGSAQVASRNDSELMVGFATGGRTSENVVVEGNSDDGSATSDTDGYCKTGECIAHIPVAGAATTNARALLTQFNGDGFRLNWIERGVTGRKNIYLAIKGGVWQAGALTIAGNSGGATATVSGLAFTPIGVSLIGCMTAEQSADSTTAEDRVALGSGSSTSSRRTQGGWSEHGMGTAAEVDLIVEYDQVLAYPSAAGAVVGLKDINAINVDGFQLIADSADGVASEWIGWLAFGTVRFPEFHQAPYSPLEVVR